MFRTNLTPPTVDQLTIDHYVAKGKRARSQAVTGMVKALFSAPGSARINHDRCSA